MTNLIKVLKQIAPLTDQECARLLDITKSVQLEKGDFWIEAGKANDKVAFLEDGYLRKFYLKDGSEITDYFYFENDFCADLPAIIGNSLPHAFLVAMKKTRLTTFSYHEFNQLGMTIPAIEHLHRVILEHTFLRFYNRTISFILKTPKQRYDELLVTAPHILENVTQYHIASYLGISPQHLSRLRSEF